MAAGCMGLTSLTGKQRDIVINEVTFYCFFVYCLIFLYCIIVSLLIKYHQDNLSFMFLYFNLYYKCWQYSDFFILSSCLVPGNPHFDSLGSIGVGTLLGTVSAFLIYTNTEALLGRSIQAERVQKLTEFLENDPAVRSENKQVHTHIHTHICESK